MRRKSGYIYCLHFDAPISERHTCQHYVGYADDVERRLAEHAAGRGARLTQVALERGIGWEVVWVAKGTRRDERRIKNRKNTPALCPICRARRGKK